MEHIDVSYESGFIPFDEINECILSMYNLKVLDIENIKFKDTVKQRAIYKVNSDKGIKCLKKVYYNKETLLFIYSIIEWLNSKGIKCPRLISTKKGIKYVEYMNSFYILTDWIDGRKCDYDDVNDIIAAAEKLAMIHKTSKNFVPIRGSQIKTEATNYNKSFNKHFLQLLELSNSAFMIGDKFSKNFLEHFDYNISAAKESIYILSQIDFSKPIGDEVSQNAICHLDYVNKNLIFTPNNDLYIIDFDRAAIEMPIHDIYYFIRRILKRENTSWDYDIYKTAISSYENIRALSRDEKLALYALLMFPHKFWKVSRDYYKNRHQCNKEAFISILKKLTRQQKEHEIFCNLLRDDLM